MPRGNQASVFCQSVANILDTALNASSISSDCDIRRDVIRACNTVISSTTWSSLDKFYSESVILKVLRAISLLDDEELLRNALPLSALQRIYREKLLEITEKRGQEWLRDS